MGIKGIKGIKGHNTYIIELSIVSPDIGKLKTVAT